MGGKILISADHGLAVVYFLQSDVVPRLLEAGREVVLLTDDSLTGVIRERFGRPGLTVEGLRLSAVRDYAARTAPEIQWWLAFLRRVGGSRRINTHAMDSYVDQVVVEEPNRRRLWMPLARLAIGGLRRSRRLRSWLVRAQERFTPGIYRDLLERHRPGLVVASTSGWRWDRYLLREAHAAGVVTAAAMVGWDNPSSYGLPGAAVDWIACWSEIQRRELIEGSDWRADRVRVVGIPSYDGYFRRTWEQNRVEYFQKHGLDPKRRLLAYACSFVSFSPNWQNIQALARMVSDGSLGEPSQLLVRLHPNHFQDVHLYREEKERIIHLASEVPNLRVVEPIPLGGELGYYSGEDMPEKASMMAHADVFVTVYSTMVVEAAIHDRPIVSACLDAPEGWNTKRKYSLALSQIGSWPTHARFRESGAGRVALDKETLRKAMAAGLADRGAEAAARLSFVQREVTHTDGSSGARAAEFLLGLG
ncbi:MAG: CDP-glycerol glycerophosphotransferase family protein [Anaerolineales bacterium]